MDVEKFSKSPSGRIVKSGRGDTAYWSFKKFAVSHQGAMKALQGLEKLKILKLLQDKQRNRRYVARDILKIME